MMDALTYLQSQLRHVEPSGGPNPENEALQYLLKAIDIAKGLPAIDVGDSTDEPQHDMVFRVLFCDDGNLIHEREQAEFVLMVAYLQVVKALLALADTEKST